MRVEELIEKLKEFDRQDRVLVEVNRRDIEDRYYKIQIVKSDSTDITIKVSE